MHVLVIPGGDGLDDRVGGFEGGFFSAARLTLDDVVAMGRWAYRPASTSDFPVFFYDGINFWWQRRLYERTMITGSVVPTDGWRHRRTCNCRICRRAGD